MASNSDTAASEKIPITPLLKQLAYFRTEGRATADQIAAAFALIFKDQLSPVQVASFLVLLHMSERDWDPEVIVRCAEQMRLAALQTDRDALRAIAKERGRPEGSYQGGFCDIVGTGGDNHSTFNISTTASIITSSLLILSKHGNRAQTSKSGSADVLEAIAPSPPKIHNVFASNLPQVYRKTNYAFLFAPNFHPGMKYAAPMRRELGVRTIFNLLGPLANPIEDVLEARVVGVAQTGLGPIFAEALRLAGAKKALVVCGEEELDEISCAGPTNCWRVVERNGIVGIEQFKISPNDFGLPIHALTSVCPGRLPNENAKILMDLLANRRDRDDPIQHFVQMNAAALFVISGICDADTSNMGPGDDGKVIKDVGPGGLRWKEGLRRARWAIESGEALKSLQGFINVTQDLEQST
ncbi:MAG: anthranilate phosphoribosyltransferase [Cirrosporium novae-zelandiae]|nr:MAG: anthranilate phosphoribosyltransferase [Cirrosporium novae-zelandiae]